MVQSARALTALIVLMCIGLLGVLVFSVTSQGFDQFFARLGVGLLIAGAALVTGGLLGFLFGIPRTHQDAPAACAVGGGAQAVSGDGHGPDYRPNTNLEQISDWLTKILVGVGLTQLTVLPEKLEQLAQHAARGLDEAGNGATFALSLMIYYHVSGFLFCFLWTRLYLPREFREADIITTLLVQVNRVNKKIDALAQQTDLDARALNYVQRQLRAGSDNPPVTPAELAEAIKAASPAARALIFAEAQQLRRDNWRATKDVMAQAIPVFRALIASDPEGRSHRFHGQLGYCLKDQSKPAWEEAKAELTTAIDLRGPPDEGWALYEFNRAFCKMKLDTKFAVQQRSDDQAVGSILADLRVATQGDLRETILGDPDLAAWLRVNGLVEKDLG
jgi:hypothetical protein